jgi:hypothetical protein
MHIYIYKVSLHSTAAHYKFLLPMPENPPADPRPCQLMVITGNALRMSSCLPKTNLALGVANIVYGKKQADWDQPKDTTTEEEVWYS